MCGGEIEVSRCMLVGAVRAGARPVFNVVLKDRAKWKRIEEWTLQSEEPVYNNDSNNFNGKDNRTSKTVIF